MKTQKIILALSIALQSILCMAQAPTGYYDAAHNKKGAELKTALKDIINDHIVLGFAANTAQYWGDIYFKKTDRQPATGEYPNGYVWDMYSPIVFENYASSLMAREHCMPRSWWRSDNTSDLQGYSAGGDDLHNLYPAETKTNGKKSDHPLGEVQNPTYDNGMSRLGPNTFGTQYSGVCFEPDDEYKGDFARTYLYMVTCYEDYDSRWKGESVSMINNNTFPVFKEWAIDMLRQWSQNDPVSDKERARNNAVFALQGNRNPYIDYPELIDCIWDEGETAFTLPVLATTPVLFSPTAESELKWGTKEKSNYSTNKEIFIKGTLLTQPVTISTASGSTTRFSFSPSIVTAEEANAGFHLTVTFKPTAVGEFNEILKVTGAETGTVEVPLSGTVIEKLPTPLPVFPTDDHDVVLFYNNSWLSNFPDNFQTNITISGNTYNYSYSSHYDTLLGFKASNTYLQIEYEREAEFLQFSLRSSNAWSDKDNHILVYESADGSNWGEAIYDVDNSFGTIADDQNYNNTPEIPLSQDSRFLKIVYQKEAQNVMLNNILLANTKEQNMMTPVSGNIMVYAHNGILYTRNLPAGTPLYVYSLQGKLLQTVIPRSACETLCLPSKGLFIVKTGDKSFKIVN